jgi:hypothetical protein
MADFPGLPELPNIAKRASGRENREACNHIRYGGFIICDLCYLYDLFTVDCANTVHRTLVQ